MKYAKLFALFSLLCLCFTACGTESVNTTVPPDTSYEALLESYETWEYRDRFNYFQYQMILDGRQAGLNDPKGGSAWEIYADLSSFSVYTEQETYTPDTQRIKLCISSSQYREFDFCEEIRVEKWDEASGSWQRLSYGESYLKTLLATVNPPFQTERGTTYHCEDLCFSNLLYPEWEEWPVGKYRAVAFIGANSAALYAPFEIVEG